MEEKKIYYDKEKGCLIAPKTGWKRMKAAFCIRLVSAASQLLVPPKEHPCNGDEQLPGKIGSYTKGLPHNSLGEVVSEAYDQYMEALSSEIQRILNQSQWEGRLGFQIHRLPMCMI
ncbi:hypothetical protein LIT38_04405 [Bacillus sp. CMF12]|uniref:hypothetical protein n=1 Tax=Bacillaceae TaxID=186817 RepID=UPI001FB20F6F|nr:MULTISPECIES: hypothetical protein [Bacillaceae]USK50709.1 hypothetical protein LIT38_04405 [Bacillus sp. CMF12]